MQYAILLYDDEKAAERASAGLSEAEQQAELQKWFDVTEAMKEAGVLVGGEALHPVTTATTLRTVDGKVVSTDGPFAETKEQLGGFYLINVENLDEALAWAKRMPNLWSGSIEVRPVMTFS